VEAHASAELESECIVVFVDLPVEGVAGQGSFLVSDGEIAEEKPLPATLPDPYHLGARPRQRGSPGGCLAVSACR